QVTASQRKKNSPKLVNKEECNQSDKPYHARSMNWVQRLKRVFNIDITEYETCEKHNVKIVAFYHSAHGYPKTLSHLDK
ncbi:MAG: IS91 family transposase, partial [Sinobacterium sp.]